MTEQEWLTGKNPCLMLKERLPGEVSGRKWRLFAVACCRRIWQLLPDEQSQQAIEVADRFADGKANDEELAAARSSLHPGPKVDARTAVLNATAHDAHVAAGLAFRSVAYAAALDRSPDDIAATLQDELKSLATLLRDIFGNPFRPVEVHPSWILWEGGWFKRKAQTIYDERRFADLPLLADALQEAGCTDADILAHLRSPGPHIRGCWAVDLILAKR